jgi:hypothetical protein
LGGSQAIGPEVRRIGEVYGQIEAMVGVLYGPADVLSGLIESDAFHGLTHFPWGLV